jgi:hypothetical protein
MLKTIFHSIRQSVLKFITPLVERFRHSQSSFETPLHLKPFTNTITYKSVRLFAAQPDKAGVCSFSKRPTILLGGLTGLSRMGKYMTCVRGNQSLVHQDPLLRTQTLRLSSKLLMPFGKLNLLK